MFFIVKNGFTLLELIVCVAIICIISSYALPAFHRHQATQEMQVTAKKIQTFTRQAKNLASIQNSNIVICPSENFTQCQPSKWSSGFVVFVDQNKNRQIDSTESILHQEKLDLKYSTLDWHGTLSIPSLTFQATTGIPLGSNGSFFHCSLTKLPHQKIIMSKMGHVRLENINIC